MQLDLKDTFFPSLYCLYELLRVWPVILVSFHRENARIFGVPVRYGWSDKTPAVMLASLASPQDPYQVRTAFYNGKKGNGNAQLDLLLSALESYSTGHRWLASMASGPDLR